MLHYNFCEIKSIVILLQKLVKMTTIGVATYRHDNPKDVFVPAYSYRIPVGRRVQLVSVKEGIYHPRLPTIRQLDRDRVLQKLPDEHCRTSLPEELTLPATEFSKSYTNSIYYTYKRDVL